jgi:hypothetical protein
MSQPKQGKTQSKSNSTSKGQPKKPARKQRGTLLTILLVVILLHSIFASYLAYITLKDDYTGSANWIIVSLVLVTMGNLAAAVGMWFWKKWAVYLYGAMAVLAGVVHIVLTGSTMVLFYDLIPVVILGYVISVQSKRSLFV